MTALSTFSPAKMALDMVGITKKPKDAAPGMGLLGTLLQKG